MKTISEILNFDEDFYNKHRLDEMSTISRPVDGLPKSTKICVYCENDEQGTKTPHFHVIIDNGKIELEVKFEHIRNMEIWRTKRNSPKTWQGYSNVKDEIISWFNKINPQNKGLTNLELMILSWNMNNPTNEIDDDFVL